MCSLVQAWTSTGLTHCTVSMWRSYLVFIPIMATLKAPEPAAQSGKLYLVGKGRQLSLGSDQGQTSKQSGNVQGMGVRSGDASPVLL
jgi:hypothetical protein